MYKHNFIKIHSLFQKIEILTSIKGHNSDEKFRKMSFVSNNTYTKFDRNPPINSQDIEHKQNSDVDQGPQLC